jgi:hypothetical protein
VIVDQFNVAGVAISESENNPPVGAHRYRPETSHIALERMKVESVMRMSSMVWVSSSWATMLRTLSNRSGRIPLASFFSKSLFSP